jgi:nicotinate-nucleotide--dimethylbenzimidazole phosphoribosyltransferase
VTFPPADRAAVYRAIHTRRDIRAYRPDVVAPEVLWRVLEAAHQAPSVGFMQPWNFVLVQDEGLRTAAWEHVVSVSNRAGQTYAGDRAASYGALKLQGILDAPVSIVVTCDPTRGGNVLGRHTMPETDSYSTCLAIQNLWLAARAEGLGVGWVSILEPAFVRSLLGIPEHVQIIAWLTLGWPVEIPAEPMLQSVGWRSRLPLESLVFRDRWEGGAVEPSAPLSVPVGPSAAAERNDNLTKPPGSLGRLEAIALQISAVQGTPWPRWQRKALVLCASDHGVTAEGVSAYRPEVTTRMVTQFVAGAAAVNAFARQNGIALTVADLGVDHDFGAATGVLHRKIRRGTRNFTVEPAMTPEECARAIQVGRELVPDCDLLAIGEMGIGNSTSAAAVVCALLGADPEAIVGRGTGVGDETWARKVGAVARGLELHAGADPLQCLGGYEIAALVGLIDEAALRGIPVILDGFITGAAALVAVRARPAVAGALIAAHRSAEAGHAAVLHSLGLVPLLDLSLRLGEGSGAALAVGLVEAACRTLSEMRTFDEAGIVDAVDVSGRR